jgi:hypothetical protein
MWNKLGENFGWKWKPSVYGHIPQVFFAVLEKPPPRVDIWDTNANLQEKEKGEEKGEKIVGPKGYLYFVINASVGAGAKGRNNINSVHIRFRLIPMKKEISEPEVVHMYPRTMSQLAGTREVTEDVEKQVAAGAKGDISVPSPGVIAKIFGGGSYWKSLQEKMNYKLPYHVVTANASGTGNRAIWEFYQERGMAAVGQFDLKIYFRIPETDLPQDWVNNEVFKRYYCIDWNVEINRKRLVDHSIDFNGKWNIKVNGRHLMDFENKTEFQKNSEGKLELKYKEYWNVPLPYDDDNGGLDKSKLNKDQKKERDKRKEERDKRKKMILDMMNEEDSDTEPLKLLRPLYLVSTSQ